MFGPPEDQPGECNAHLYIADDYGDNSATMRCGLQPDHDGPHIETYMPVADATVTVTWQKDERGEDR